MFIKQAKVALMCTDPANFRVSEFLAKNRFSPLTAVGEGLLQQIHSLHSPETIVQALPLLLLGGQMPILPSLIKLLSQQTLSSEGQGQLVALDLRLHLLGVVSGLQAENVSSAELPNWVKDYEQTGSDPAYPTTLKGISCEKSENAQILILNICCAACGAQISSATDSGMFPWNSEGDTYWFCPHCLARHQWERKVLRDDLWDAYTQEFHRQPVDAQGKLSQDSMLHLLLLAMAIEPYAPVRFCSFRQERIGHLCFGGIRIVEQLQGTEKLTLDFYGVDTEKYVANQTLLRLLYRFFQPTVAAQQLYYFAHALGAGVHSEYVQWANDTSTGNRRFLYPVHMNYKEIHNGLRCLEKMGIPRGARIACLWVREEAYLNRIHPEGTDSTNGYRNADVNTYQAACQALVDRGWYVVRMGAVVNAPLAWASSRIIDYSTHHRSDFMDIWFLLHADLSITSASGPDTLLMMRNAHTIFVNAIDLWYTGVLHDNSLILPKRMSYGASGTPLSLAQYLRTEADFDTVCKNVGSDKILYISNTSEEIVDAVMEKVDMMDGCFSTTKCIEDLQDHYRALTANKYEVYGKPWGATKARFSSKFLLAEQGALLK